MIRVKHLDNPELHISRRYEDFKSMHKRLRTEFPGKVLPPLPRRDHSDQTHGYDDDDDSSESSMSLKDTVPESSASSGGLGSWLPTFGYGRKSTDGGHKRSGQVRQEAWRAYVRPTLPFSVVAANSFAAASAACDSRIASVVVHASCCDIPSALPTTILPTRTYRLLELLEELVCLLFLCPVSCRLHHIVCC